MDASSLAALASFLSLIAFIAGIFVLLGFYNLCGRVSQIRDDNHALRIMIEEELKRAARGRFSPIPPPDPK